MAKPSPYRDPGAEQRMMEAESKIRKMEEYNKAFDEYTKKKKEKKKAKKKECSPCGTKSLTGSTYSK